MLIDSFHIERYYRGSSKAVLDISEASNFRLEQWLHIGVLEEAINTLPVGLHCSSCRHELSSGRGDYRDVSPKDG